MKREGRNQQEFVSYPDFHSLLTSSSLSSFVLSHVLLFPLFPKSPSCFSNSFMLLFLPRFTLSFNMIPLVVKTRRISIPFVFGEKLHTPWRLNKRKEEEKTRKELMVEGRSVEVLLSKRHHHPSWKILLQFRLLPVFSSLLFPSLLFFSPLDFVSVSLSVVFWSMDVCVVW